LTRIRKPVPCRIEITNKEKVREVDFVDGDNGGRTAPFFSDFFVACSFAIFSAELVMIRVCIHSVTAVTLNAAAKIMAAGR